MSWTALFLMSSNIQLYCLTASAVPWNHSLSAQQAAVSLHSKQPAGLSARQTASSASQQLGAGCS